MTDIYAAHDKLKAFVESYVEQAGPDGLLVDEAKALLQEVHVPRYNWSMIPEHLNYAATDKDGATFGYVSKPTCFCGHWNDMGEGDECVYLGITDYLTEEEARASLEKRP